MTSSLAPPSKRLMSPPEPLPDLKEGDDLFEEHAKLRAQYGRETGKTKGLQGYVKTILKK